MATPARSMRTFTFAILTAVALALSFPGTIRVAARGASHPTPFTFIEGPLSIVGSSGSPGTTIVASAFGLKTYPAQYRLLFLNATKVAAGGDCQFSSNVLVQGIPTDATGAFSGVVASIPSGAPVGVSAVCAMETYPVKDATASTIVSFRVVSSAPSSVANGVSDSPSVSDDGSMIAYRSDATNTTLGDTNLASDVMVRSRLSGLVSEVSVSSSGARGNSVSLSPSISRDGTHVAFQSYATNLVSDDTNGVADVFERNLTTGKTIAVSRSSTGAQANGYSESPSVSSDGRYVAFASTASNLVLGQSNGLENVFVRDTLTKTTTIASVDSLGIEGNGRSYSPSISGDGRYVAFASDASNLVAGDTNGVTDVFLRDTVAGTTVRVSVDSNGNQGAGRSYSPSLSGDGLHVAFVTRSSFDPSDSNSGGSDIYVRNLAAGTTVWASVGSFQPSAPYIADHPSISDDGSYVAYDSNAQLVGFNGNYYVMVLEYGLVTGQTTFLSMDSWRNEANGDSYAPSISGNSVVTAFVTAATNLIADNTDGFTNVDVHVYNQARTWCYVNALSQLVDAVIKFLDPGPTPQTNETVYRVWGNDALEFGQSWTPIDPRDLGPQIFREVAGLPDRLNSGVEITVGVLTNSNGVSQVRQSLPIGPDDDCGNPNYSASGCAYRDYGGGLTEFVIPNAKAYVTPTAVIDESATPYGGPPVGCTPAARGCVGG